MGSLKCLIQNSSHCCESHCFLFPLLIWGGCRRLSNGQMMRLILRTQIFTARLRSREKLVSKGWKPKCLLGPLLWKWLRISSQLLALPLQVKIKCTHNSTNIKNPKRFGFGFSANFGSMCWIMGSGKTGPKSRNVTPMQLQQQAGFLRSKKLSLNDWEEQAYQIILRQKLRNASPRGKEAQNLFVEPHVLDMRGSTDKQFEPYGIPPPEQVLLVHSILNFSSQKWHFPLFLHRLTLNVWFCSEQFYWPQQIKGISLEDAVFQRLARELGLERKWQPLMEYLTTLGICEGDFQRIADRHKACLQANVTAVQERVEFLVSLGVKREHLRKLIVRHPQIIEYTVERAVKPRIQYLKSLGLPENAFGRVITVAPSLLECSLQRSLKPRVRYLVDTVGVKEADMGLIITRSPQVSALIFMLI